MDDRTREAIQMRLDTRCIKWPMVMPVHPQRCNDCDGCIAARWFSSGGGSP